MHSSNRGRGKPSQASRSDRQSTKSSNTNISSQLSQSSIDDSREKTRLGFGEIYNGTFSSTSSTSGSSFSSYEGRAGIDVQWVHENTFTLYLTLIMEPLEYHASGIRDIIFDKESVELAIQDAIEDLMSKDDVLSKCFITPREGDPFLPIPVKITVNPQNTKDIHAIICPPQLKNAPNSDTARTIILKSKPKFPVTFRKEYVPKTKGPHAWVITFHESSPADDLLSMNIEFQIKYDDEAVRKDSKLAWSIICEWFNSRFSLDLNDVKHFSTKISTRPEGPNGRRCIFPRYTITYTADNLGGLKSFCKLLGSIQNTRVMIEPTDQLLSGFEFRFYSAFLDPKIKEPRPISLKETIGEIFEAASSHSTPTAVVRTLFMNGPAVLGFNANEASLKIRQGGIPLEDHQVTAIIKELVADKTLTPNHSVPGNFVSTPNLRPWKARRLYVNEKTYFDIQERDLGIWLDSSFGLPTSVPPIQFQCFYLCAGTSVTSISRAKFTTADIRDYMIYRASQFKVVCDMLRANQYAMNIMDKLFDESVRSSELIDPEDGTTLPPFYLCYSNLQEIADSAANDGYASPLLYKYCLPTELSDFNWLAVTASISPISANGMDATDQLKATHSVPLHITQAQSSYDRYNSRWWLTRPLHPDAPTSNTSRRIYSSPHDPSCICSNATRKP